MLSGLLLLLLTGLLLRLLLFLLAAAALPLLGLLVAPPKAGQIFAGMFLADTYAVFFKVVFLMAVVLTVLISLRYLDDEGSHHGEYYAMLLFATVGMMFMAGGGDLISIYLGLELMSLSTYVLVGFIRRDVTSIEGAVKYFLMGAFTSGILLYGLALFYGLTGSTNLYVVAQSLSGLALDNPALIFATILAIDIRRRRREKGQLADLPVHTDDDAEK